MAEVNDLKPQQAREEKKNYFHAVSRVSLKLVRAQHGESDPEHRSCTVAAQEWLDLAGSSRELVSFWVLERAWSLSGEWVEIQGITQGGVLTTELQKGHFVRMETTSP